MQQNRLRAFTIALMVVGVCIGEASLRSQTVSSAPVTQAGPSNTLKVSTQLVVLDTIVSGSGGKPASNLTGGDFRVYQDGIEQKVLYFEVHQPNPALPMQPTMDHNGKPNWGSATKTILVLDELNTPWEETAYSRIEVNRYLRSLPEALPGPTMVMFVNDQGFHPLGPYTRDQKTLLKEVAAHMPALPGKLTRGATDELLAQSFAILQQIALSTRGESGRKLIIWIGEGFQGVDVKDLDPDIQDRFLSAIRHTTNLLLDSRITVYKVDPSPTPPPPSVVADDEGGIATASETPMQDPSMENFNFNSFVQQTGGEYFYNRNDLDREIATGIGEGSTYYTLVYRPSSQIDSVAYHQIRIVMRDPHLHARTKSGYYPPEVINPHPDSKELGFDLYEAAVSGMNYTGLGTHVDRCIPDGMGGQVKCRLHVDTSSVTFEDMPAGGHKTSLVVVMVALNAKNKILSKTGRQFTEEISASDARPLNIGYFAISLDGEIPPDARFARIIVRDVSGRIGTADIDLSTLPRPPVRNGRRYSGGR